MIQLEILSEDPIEEADYMDLDTVVYHITDGDWSGDIKLVAQEELDGKQTAEALMNQRSSPSFFNLTEEGENDADCDEDDEPTTEQHDGTQETDASGGHEGAHQGS